MSSQANNNELRRRKDVVVEAVENAKARYNRVAGARDQGLETLSEETGSKGLAGADGRVVNIQERLVVLGKKVEAGLAKLEREFEY